ncbi:hypothetical protein EMCRGX_G001256 [Ephydatia muelleri]
MPRAPWALALTSMVVGFRVTDSHTNVSHPFHPVAGTVRHHGCYQHMGSPLDWATHPLPCDNLPISRPGQNSIHSTNTNSTPLGRDLNYPSPTPTGQSSSPIYENYTIGIRRYQGFYQSFQAPRRRSLCVPPSLSLQSKTIRYPAHRGAHSPKAHMTATDTGNAVRRKSRKHGVGDGGICKASSWSTPR